MPSDKENFVSIYLSPEDYDRIEELKALRRGRGASKTAVVRDIVHYFFALPDAEVQRALNIGSNEPITVKDGEAAVTMKTCERNPQHQWIADIDFCPYCSLSPERRVEYLQASGGQS